MTTSILTVPAKSDYTFRNWAGIYTAKPQKYFQPTNVQEVINIVNAARAAGKTVVTVGSGHSPSNMCITNEWLINLDKMNSVQSFKEYPERHYADITVAAGLRVYQLNAYLNKKGYTLQNLGSVAEQSVAGIISTGTHGSSPYHGLFSSQYVNLTIVNGNGQLVYLDSEHNPEIFRAAALSLGKIGIIVSATIRAVPAFNIRSTQEVITFEEFLEQWDSVWLSSEFIRVWWYPYSRKCVLWRGSKSHDNITPEKKSWWATKMGRFFYETLLWISSRVYLPLTPLVEKFVFKKQYGELEKHPTTAVQRSADGFALDCLFSQFVDEWACPMDNGPEVLRSLDYSISQASFKK